LSDIDEVEEIASRLEMNPRERARYNEHLEEIKKHSKKAKFWKFWNFIWQVVFFWGLVVIAIEAGQRYSEQFVPSVSPVFTYMNYVTFPMSLIVGVLGPFSFFLMIWTGIIRSKWEGKLTRATAYTLSFLSNIEHRGFMALDEHIEGLKKEIKKKPEDKKELPTPQPRKSAREPQKVVRRTERDEMQEKSEILKKAYQEKRITIEEYEKYMKRLREMYRHMK
jgi:ABC-type multidrug transport system fused ATPase/permease subunit